MSSFVLAVPEELAAASRDLIGLGAAIGAANTVAAAPTTGIVATWADSPVPHRRSCR